jgi:hypothetical protein
VNAHADKLFGSTVCGLLEVLDLAVGRHGYVCNPFLQPKPQRA